MVPQSHQRHVLLGISVQMAQNLPHNIRANQALITTLLTRRQSRHANCVIQASTVKVLHAFGPMTCVMRAFSALADLGASVQEILVSPVTVTQQALLIAATQHLNVFVQHGTKLQVK